MNRHPIVYRETDSTNAEASRLLKTGNVPEGLVIRSDYQSSGRGQGKHSWVSDRGKNLLMSWIVYPAFLSVSEQFQLSKAVSLAITDFLSRHALDVKIKWPNDILCNGEKICGILIENSLVGIQLRHSIVGIGLNVHQEVFPDFPWKATSMQLQIGVSYALGDLADGLTDCLEARYEQLAEQGSGEINRSYLERLYRIDEPSLFKGGNTQFTGVIRGVDDTGQVQVERRQSIRSYGFHEVTMIY
jgi:BirA family biotin operon repressor/biotin-[acetyl-CoA-carboxylase] ligase